MKLSWPRKIFLYSVLLAGLSVSLTALATVRTASHLWEQEFLTRNTAYSLYTSLDVLRTFGGRFSGGTDPELAETVRNLTKNNGDLIALEILTESGRELFSAQHRVDGNVNVPESDAWYEGRDAAVQAVTGSLQPMARSFKDSGRRYLDVLAPVTGLGGGRPIAVRYLYTYTTLEEKTADLVRWVIIAALGLMILAALLSAYLSRALTRPVSVLSASARRIADGDREHRIELHTGDEIEELSSQFNQMLESLSVHRRDLEEANRDLLEANRKLTELQVQLVRSERLAALGQLSAGVSHELDNPVGVILGYAELTMEESEPGSRLYEYAMMVREEAKRCKRIISGLLDFARPSRGVIQRLSLGPMITELVDHLQDQRPFRKVRWNLDLGEDERTVEADPDSMRQILVNLALNASQAMDEAGLITISLRDADVSDGDGHLMLFTDTGRGIPVGDEERIFDPFFSTKRRGEGTGLGLSICRKLVEEMGGWIRARPAGNGIFELWLPRAGSDDRCTAEESKDE